MPDHCLHVAAYYDARAKHWRRSKHFMARSYYGEACWNCRFYEESAR